MARLTRTGRGCDVRYFQLISSDLKACVFKLNELLLNLHTPSDPTENPLADNGTARLWPDFKTGRKLCC